MNDGIDKSRDSGEPMVIEVKGESLGRSVAVGSLCPSPESSPTVNQDAEDSRITEHRAYIDSQIREDWIDLDFKERAFCDEYLENGHNHIEAAETVSYARSAGRRLISKPLLREYILWKEQQIELRSMISREFIDAKLLEVLDESSGEVDIAMVDKDGIEFRAKKYNGPLKLAIIQEMGKVSGISKPEIAEGAAPVNVIIDVAGLLGTKIKEVN